MYAQRDERFRAVVDSARALVVRHRRHSARLARARRPAARTRDRRRTRRERWQPARPSDGLRLYFFGGAPGVAEARPRAAACAGIRRASIAGARDGYFSRGRKRGGRAAIAASGANVFCVGLGSPKQEFWLAAYLTATGCGVGIGVGGSFDVICGQRCNARRLRCGAWGSSGSTAWSESRIVGAVNSRFRNSQRSR